MTKRLSTLLSIAFLAATLPASADVLLSLDAGLLTDQNGTPISDGNLILLIASPSGVFTPTVGNEFVSGDNLILGSTPTTAGGTGAVTGAFAMTSTETTPGETLNIINFSLGAGATGTSTFASTSIVAGDKLAIRWYSDFTLAEFEAGDAPTGSYGTYTTTAVLPNNDGGAPWVVPTDGSTLTASSGPAAGLMFFTSSDPLGGDQSPLLGEALTPTGNVSGAVPEPSTYALLAAGLLFLAVTVKRKQKLATVRK